MSASPSRMPRLYRSLQRKVEEYERLKEFSENIVESINVGILAADLEDRVESWNTPDRAAHRHPARAGAGRHAVASCSRPSCASSSTGARRDRHPPHLQVRAASRSQPLALARQRPTATATATATSNWQPRDREATLNIAIAPLVSKDQEQIGRLIIFDDVTDRAELEQRLVQADKLSSHRPAGGRRGARGQYAAGGDLHLRADAGQAGGRTTTQKSMMLEKIAKQTFRASEIVNSLLNFSRTSTTEFGEVESEQGDPGNALAARAPVAESRRGQRICDLRARPAAVHGNAGKLQQVFLNLFLNARDAMEGGRHAGRSAPGRKQPARAGRSRRHGPGHRAREHLHRIYDPFFTTKAAPQGHRPGLVGHLRYHSGAWRLDRSLKAGAAAARSFHLELPARSCRRAGERSPVEPAAARSRGSRQLNA